MLNLWKLQIPLVLSCIGLLFSLKVVSATNPRERSASFSMNTGRSGVLFDAAIYYGQTEATADPAAGNEWKNLTSIYDIKLGYILDSSIYLGAEYSTRKDASILSTTSGGTSAVGIGYFWGSGFHARSFYRMNENFGDYSNGTGFQADLGYMINMSSNFYLGLLVSHRQVTFTKNDTISNFKSQTKKDTQPMVTLGFLIN